MTTASLRTSVRVLALAAFAITLASLPFLHSRHGGPHLHHHDAPGAGAPAHPH